MRETVLPAHALLHSFVWGVMTEAHRQMDGQTDIQGPEVTVVEKTLTHFACSSLVSKHTCIFYFQFFFVKGFFTMSFYKVILTLLILIVMCVILTL